jgi:PAS domain S-box-containing protein
MKKNQKTFEAKTPPANISLESYTILQDKERLLELIADNTPAFIAYIDMEERYRFTNKVFQEWLGFSKEETYLKSVKEIRGDKAYKAMHPYLKKALAGQTMSYDHSLIKKDGSKIYVNAKYVPHRNDRGKVEGVYVLILDITDRKIVEEKMKENDDRLKRLMEGNIIGVVISGLGGAIYEANDIYLDMVGYTRADLRAGKVNWLDMTPEEYRSINLHAEKEIMSKGSAHPYEKEYIRKDGSRVAVLVGDVLLDKQSQTLIAFILDISKQKELEKRKDEFIALASHELKTPLTSLKMYGQLVERFSKDTLSDKSARLLANMDKQIDKLTNLVDDLLDVSRIQSGKLQYRKESFVIDKLVKETVEDLQRLSPRHTLSVEGQTRQIVRADRNRIKQVITNLLTNALKYSPKADKVLVTILKKGNEVQIGIRDFGIGIPTDQQRKIFDRFFQIKRPLSHTYSGLGLGLYVTKEIIDRHKGKIWVESKKGKGTTVYFSLPLGKKRKDTKKDKNP